MRINAPCFRKTEAKYSSQKQKYRLTRRANQWRIELATQGDRHQQRAGRRRNVTTKGNFAVEYNRVDTLDLTDIARLHAAHLAWIAPRPAKETCCVRSDEFGSLGQFNAKGGLIP
jgi:hypothetical protein